MRLNFKPDDIELFTFINLLDIDSEFEMIIDEVLSINVDVSNWNSFFITNLCFIFIFEFIRRREVINIEIITIISVNFPFN